MEPTDEKSCCACHRIRPWLLAALLAVACVFGALGTWLPFLRAYKDLHHPPGSGPESAFSLVFRDPAFTEAMKHGDGSHCFLANSPPARIASDAELRNWLKEFGKKRLLDFAETLYYLKRPYEMLFHGPDPDQASLQVIQQLKWRSFPLGSRWRTFQAAAFEMQWILNYPRPRISADLREALLPEYTKHVDYFARQDFFRLLAMARGWPSPAGPGSR